MLLVLLLSVDDVVEKARFVVDVVVDFRRVLRSVGLRVNAYNMYICTMLKVLENERMSYDFVKKEIKVWFKEI